jgi:tetratricopeptide (TPR) repeat protein
MTNRGLLALAGLTIVAFVASPAGAAISVLGNGISKSCYAAAEFGGDPRDGIATCTDALNLTPLSVRDRAATLVNRGILRSRADDSEGALADYNTGLSLDASLGEGYVDRGATEIVLKNYDVALADINRGIALKANKLEIAYYDRGIVDEAMGNVKNAYNDYKMAVELEPDFALANEQLMRFKVVRRRTDGA